ncbi:MAG: hypothetical protein ACO3FI_08350 [Cyclobacteriaceae bacterium]
MDTCELSGLSDLSCSAITWGLYLGYMLFFGSLLAIAGLFLMNAFKDINLLKKSLGGAILLLIIFGLSYFLSGSELSSSAVANGITESSSKLIGGGLTMFYILFFLAILGLIYSEINKALK